MKQQNLKTMKATQAEKIKEKKSKGNIVQFKSQLLTTPIVNSESRIVSGYLAAFGNKDSANDILEKGCFSKSLQERGVGSTSPRKIAFLWQHDMSQPIGHFTKLEEDDKGLYFEAFIDRTQKGDEIIEQYKSGTLNQHSIGFKYVWDKVNYKEDTDTYYVKEVNLFEGSVVTLGCNEETPFLGLKQEAIESEREKIEKETEVILKSIENEATAYAIRKIIKKHIALTNSQEPSKHTLLHENGEPLSKAKFNVKCLKNLKQNEKV